MPLTPEQRAKIRQKEETLPEALRRDPLTNYFEGYFFVSLNTRNESPTLGYVEGRADATEEEPDAPHVAYTELGKRVIEAWKRNPEIYPDVRNIAFEVMPDHVHGLLYLKPGNKRHLGSIIKGFMIGCSHAYWDILSIPWREMTYVKGVRTPQYEDKDHTRSLRGPALFVRGYNDVEPITPEEVQIKIDYIQDQAKKALIKGNNHECFAIHRNQRSRNWTMERAMLALLPAPPAPASSLRQASKLGGLFRSKGRRMGGASFRELAKDEMGGLTLAYLGRKDIMANARKLPLVCHRRDAARFEEQRSAVLKKAREGWTIVSAFISPKEREIKEQLMRELLPFVEIMDNGFAERYKPTGRAFYAVAESRLVQISPWEYEYQKDGVQISREMCLVMNELARVISRKEDDWWKK